MHNTTYENTLNDPCLVFPGFSPTLQRIWKLKCFGIEQSFLWRYLLNASDAFLRSWYSQTHTSHRRDSHSIYQGHLDSHAAAYRPSLSHTITLYRSDKNAHIVTSSRRSYVNFLTERQATSFSWKLRSVSTKTRYFGLPTFNRNVTDRQRIPIRRTISC